MKDEKKFNLPKLGFINNLTTQISNQLFDAAKDLIKNSLVYSVDITDIRWMIGQELRNVFPNLEMFLFIDQSEEYKNGYKINYNAGPETYRFNGDECCMSPVIYKKSLIILTVREIRSEDNTRTKLSLKTLNHPYHIKNLHNLIDKMARRGQKYQEEEFDKTCVIFNACLGQSLISSKQLRTFDNIFIPRKQKEEIQHVLDKYTSSRDWYIKKHIPNHFGILLYGPPGTGKTSIAQAITRYVRGQLNVVAGDNLSTHWDRIMGTITKDSISANKYRVLLIEDIDISEFKRENFSTTTNMGPTIERVGLGSLLNSIDGVNAPSNMIYILTTNHIDKLDPALIRPGRIDIKLEIGYVTEETFKEFIKFHYKTNWLQPIVVRDGLTFGELQTKVMEGYKLHELIDYVSKSYVESDKSEVIEEYEDYV